MLVLSRFSGEAIDLGADVTVHVLAVEGGRVKLGFDAPERIRIMRSELRGQDAGRNQSRERDSQGRLPGRSRLAMPRDF